MRKRNHANEIAHALTMNFALRFVAETCSEVNRVTLCVSCTIKMCSYIHDGHSGSHVNFSLISI